MLSDWRPTARHATEEGDLSGGPIRGTQWRWPIRPGGAEGWDRRFREAALIAQTVVSLPRTVLATPIERWPPESVV